MLGDAPIGEITKGRLQQFVQDRPTAPATTRKALFVIRAVFDFAADSNLISRNPARGVKGPRTDRKPLNVWTTEQITLLLNSFPVEELRWKVFSELLLLAGLRYGGAAALSPRQVSAETIIIDRAWDERGHRIKSAKSGRARSVDMPPRLKRDLLAYVENTGVGRDELLFPGARLGKCISNSWFSKKIWRPAIKRAALPWIRPHDARHTFVAYMLEAGENPVYIKQQAGHHSAGLHARCVRAFDSV